MSPEKMLTDLMAVGPSIFHFIISLLGFALVIGGLRDINKSSNFINVVEVPIGFLGVIIGLLLMYYGGAFPVIWSVIKWMNS